MKTILLIIAFAAFNIAGSYAQDKNCCCKKTAVHHKAVHRALAAKAQKPTDMTYYKPDDDACYSYRKHNIIVTECPSPSYVNDYDNGAIAYILENNYLGYYPTEVNNNITESVAPLSNHLVVGSSAFENNGEIPVKYTCEGEHASPPISVGNIPIGTQSLALVVYDPHASYHGSLTYWLAWNIDTMGNIPENFISNHQSINVSNEWGYAAVCPLSGTHYYHFVVYALDTKLLTGRNTTKAGLEREMKGHILAKGELVGVYNKHLD